MCIHLRFDYKKATQALNFFALKAGKKINKMRAIKLIYFADRYHFRKYGRPIINDEYFAMNYGPVGSGVKDIAGMTEFLGKKEQEYASMFLESNPSDRFELKSIHPLNEKVFSKTDLQALTFAWEQFGKFNHFQLAKISHEYPEWKKHESALKSQSRVRMNYEDFLDDSGGEFHQCHTLNSEDKQDRLEFIREIEQINALWN